MSWHYEPIKNKIDWTVSRCVGRFFSPFFWKDIAQCACVCGAIRNIVAVFVGPKATKICSSSLLSPFVLCFFLFWNKRRHIAVVLYAWGKVTTFSLPNHNNTEKKKKNFFSSVVKTHLSLKKWRNKKRKWAPSQPFVTTTRELTDFFFFSSLGIVSHGGARPQGPSVSFRIPRDQRGNRCTYYYGKSRPDKN